MELNLQKKEKTNNRLPKYVLGKQTEPRGSTVIDR